MSTYRNPDRALLAVAERALRGLAIPSHLSVTPVSVSSAMTLAAAGEWETAPAADQLADAQRGDWGDLYALASRISATGERHAFTTRDGEPVLLLIVQRLTVIIGVNRRAHVADAPAAQAPA